MDYRQMAERALERRSEIFEKRKAAAAKGKSDVCRVYDEEMDALAVEAREYVQEAERQAEIRGAHQRGGALGTSRPDSTEPDGDSWRGLLPSAEEYRTLTTDPSSGGAAVPQGVAGQFLDILRGKTAFLAGLPSASILRFTGGSWTLPQIGTSGGTDGLVAEGAVITAGETILEGLKFTPKKYAAMRYASSEIQADSELDARNLLAQDMLRSLATEMDADLFAGDGLNTPVTGILAAGSNVTTQVGAASGDMPTWDDIADAVQRIEDAGGEATVVWLAPDANNSLRKQRETAEGAYLSGAPGDESKQTAWSLPRKVSRNIPAGTVVVADGSRVLVGWRQDPTVRYSDDFKFDSDVTAIRMTARVAGVKVAEAESVQVLTKHV